MINLYDKLPTISTITPSLNRAKFIEEAINSVLNQDYPYIEHIIIDGGSTDGTIDVLAQFSHLRVVIEPDEGIYDAINKGIKIAKGEIIGVLNTDDYYEPQVFSSVIDMFLDHSEIQAVVGAARVFTRDNQKKKRTLIYYTAVPQKKLLSESTIGVPIFNAWFFEKKVFDQVGSFNTKYRVAADREFLIRFAMMQIPYLSIDRVIYNYQQHSGSLTVTGSNDHETDPIFENRSLAEDFLKDPNTHSKYKKSIRFWHSYITAGQCISALRKKSYKRAYSYVVYGWRHNPLWPIVFANKMTKGISRRIYKKING